MLRALASTTTSVLGKRLFELRQAKGLSLRALANAAGVSATLLSQIEREVTQPSLATLRALSSVFNEPMDALFQDPAVPTIRVSRPGERTLLVRPKDTISYERLTCGDGPMEVLRTVLNPGQFSLSTKATHETVECIYVVRGVLTVELAGITHEVRAGEAFNFDAIHSHRYGNNGNEDAEVVISITPPIP
ncbi:helix-turn-helix domain-containing protein [Variovorax sp. Sphag1AA]|uniref:helix-turn-helix domain-containing protein n=1 Tax=Variovorax sp. Sphag1AA TaxID=2587027 RepID=UPI0017BDFD06|nr:XRE family transcriptional regulator [Variovorax sp. Sphag1AA]MBB3182235.1 transcriptional regulator with XRE-family HTH domain [Variovorax sp. Sphag1AA]